MDYTAAEPTAIRAGDSVAWTRECPEHSAADGWALKYRLLYTTGTAVEITTNGSGTLHSVSLNSTATASWAAGSATLVAIVENAGLGARETLEAQPITILPNLATATTLDNRSDNQIALAAAKAALKDYMASGRLHVASYDIAGRQMQFRTADEIRGLIEYYEGECGKERALTAVLSGGSPGRVVSRM
ncbi:MAG: hypothetical protein EKK55_07120 [Rhodocyclaceae bacterium]|nr:MAG: hypothetical protein EKK55_07120 [Rhodocyclaceae bacterium]